MSQCGNPHVPGEQTTPLASLASATQNFAPLKNICAHLDAFHVDATNRSRFLEVHHYCGHLNEDFRQCLLYDSDSQDARLIGVEYMISERLYKDLDPEERKYWHSHVFEVKSGMLVMPKPPLVPETIWDETELKEMEQTIRFYGKIFHLWQVDLGHQIPLGPPRLMTSFTSRDQFDFDKYVGERDTRIGDDWRKKAGLRQGIPEPEIDPCEFLY